MKKKVILILKDYSFSAYAKYVCVSRTCAYHRVRNVNFLRKFCERTK